MRNRPLSEVGVEPVERHEAEHEHQGDSEKDPPHASTHRSDGRPLLGPPRLAGRDETENPSDRCADRRPQRPGRRRGNRPPEERVVRTRTSVSGLGRELIESDAETEAHGPDESGSTKPEGPFVSTDTSEGDAEKSAREGPKDDEPGDGLHRRHFEAAAEHVGPGRLVYPRPALSAVHALRKRERGHVDQSCRRDDGGSTEREPSGARPHEAQRISREGGGPFLSVWARVRAVSRTRRFFGEVFHKVRGEQ